MDEQIFALQPYGGISRMFASLARQFFTRPELLVELLPLAAPVINRYVLDDDFLRERLAVREARSEYRSAARYFTRVQPRRGLDVVHNTFYLPNGLASYPGARRVVTVHDMIPEMMPHTRRRLDFLTLKKRYVTNADHVICVSEATRSDLESIYGPLRMPVSVIHHGVDSRFSSDAPALSGIRSPYVLFVGQRGHYKDAAVLMRAFANIANEHPDMTLLFVGGGAFTATERSHLRTLGIDDKTLQTTLADIHMPSVYAHATAFVFPSRFEGFGIPVLEAFACGTPAILARSTSLPEVGGDAALYFEPGDANDLAEHLSRVVSDDHLRRQLSQRGRQRAHMFTWKKAAEKTAEVYREVINH